MEPTFGPGNADNVETHGPILGAMPFDVMDGGTGNLALLARIDRLPGFAMVAGNAGFNFNEDEELAQLGDEIDFTERATVGVYEYPVTGGSQKACRPPFT